MFSTGPPRPGQEPIAPAVLRSASLLERRLPRLGPVVGRITEAHLDEAEKTFPGIQRLYDGMRDKPATFLQLVWHYERRGAAKRRRLARGTGTHRTVA